MMKTDRTENRRRRAAAAMAAILGWWLAAPAWGGTIRPADAAYCAALQTHHVLNAGAPVGCARLQRVTFSYYDFAGVRHDDGEVVVMDALAKRVAAIFAELEARRFPIAKARPIEAYEGDDDASMADDNTSAFNHRPVTGGDKPSLHAYGAAIDVNPVENPYLGFKDAVVTVAPPQGAGHVNRMLHRPDKPDRAGVAEMAADVFARNGFSVWGGYWDRPIDYQHFDIGRSLAEELAALPPDAAARRFEQAIAERAGQAEKSKPARAIPASRPLGQPPEK